MENIVFNEDCMEGMARYPNKHFDLAICDVPYGIDVANMAFLKEKKTTVLQKNGNRLNPHKAKNYTSKDWDKATPEQDYFDELTRVSKHQIIFGIEYVKWNNVGSGRIIWNKGQADGNSFKKTEVAYCSLIDDTVTVDLLWAGMMQAKSLSEPLVQQGNKKLNEKRLHPCHKPILLYKKLLSLFAKPGDTILDTHIGAGSIRIACNEMNHSLTGFEIDHEYFHKQEERYQKHVLLQKSRPTLF